MFFPQWLIVLFLLLVTLETGCDIMAQEMQGQEGQRESQPLRKTRLRARVCVCVHACVRVCVRAYLCVCVFVCFWFVQEKTLLCDDICVDGAKERCMMELKILPNKWPDFRNVINDCFSHWNLIPIGSGRVIGCCVTTSVQYSQFEL